MRYKEQNTVIQGIASDKSNRTVAVLQGICKEKDYEHTNGRGHAVCGDSFL